MGISSASAATQAAAVSAAARVALAEAALQLKIGQVLDALVLGKTPAGLTQLKIGDTLVQAQLPQPVTPGTVLQLEVKADGRRLQLVIVEEGAPQQVAAAPVIAPRPAVPLSVPLVQVDVPKAANVPVAPQIQAAPSAPVMPQQATAPPLPIVESQQTPATLASQPTSSARIVVADRVPSSSGPVVVAQPQATMPTPIPATVSPTVPAIASPEQAPPLPAAGQQQASSQPQMLTSVPQPPAAPASLLTTPEPLPQVTQPLTSSVVTPTPTQTATPQVAVQQPSVVAQPESPPTPPSTQSAPTRSPVVETPLQSPLLVAQEAPRPATSVLDLPKPVVTSQPPPIAIQPPPLPPTPEAALAQMMPAAMAKQDSIAPLLLSLAALVAKPAALPTPLLRAALQVLAQRIVAPDGKVTVEALENAVAKSGVFLEANLAKGSSLPGDGKTVLLALRAAAEKLLGGASQPPVPGSDRATPPVRGLPPRAAPVDLPPLPDGPKDIARSIHQQADAAISRVKLLQLASLPDAAAPRAAAPEIRLELPFLIGHELVMAQLQIAQDGGRQRAERKRGWTMRFALNFSATGEVGAEVGLLGKTVNVALWAAEPETADLFAATLPELTGALEAIGLKPASLRVRRAPPEAGKLPSGQLLDAVS